MNSLPFLFSYCISALLDTCVRQSDFEHIPNGRYYVQVTDDIRQPPESENLERLKSSLQFNYAFSEANINSRFTNADSANSENSLESFIRESLLWIIQIVPSDTNNLDLLDLRVRALDLSHIDSDRSLGTFVPILPHEKYQQQIDSILSYITEIDRTIDRYHTDLEHRKSQELLINVAQELNQNIIDSGKLISGYVNASIAQQQALSQYYDSIIQQKQNEQKQQETTIGKLQGQLNEQQSQVATAVANYQEAIKNWQITQAIKFGLTVATDLFSLGTTIAIPASSISAVKDLGLMVQRIQKFLNVTNNTYKLYENTKNNFDQLQNAQKTFEGISGTLSANLNWDELSIKFDEVLATGPSDNDVNAKKAVLVATFKVYVLRGKAFTSAKSSVQQIARDIYNQQRQKNLIVEQVDRLNKLNTNLNPANIQSLDKSKIDLIGLTGSLSMARSQMLGILSQAFILQDRALQYTYLQPPTPISAFDTLGIKEALVNQQTNKITAETNLRQYQTSTTIPIDVEVEVPTEELRNGGVYKFNLQPNIAEFFQYVNVRVDAVVAKIDGVKSTDSGNYLLTLNYSGKPFFDRNAERDTVTFNTLYRERTYEYTVRDNQPQFTDRGETWSQGVNPITPFSIWEISLPETKTNKGINFSKLIAKVTLSFIVNARIHDDRAKLLLQFRQMLLATTPIKPSIETLLKQMSGKSVLNNWDVVFNMSLDKINNVLASQYDELKANDTAYGGKVSADTSVQGANIGNILTYTLQKFNINYGYPELHFLINDGNTGDLRLEITSGTVQKGTRYVGDNNPTDRKKLIGLATIADLSENDIKEETINGESKLVLQYYDKAEDLGTQATLQAVIKISQVKGLVDDNENILSVVLDMNKGAFAANDIQINMSDEQKIAFSEAVKAYFQEHPVKFIINSLDLTEITTLADLKPHQFLFKALKTQAGNEMLQMFIQTNQRDAFNYSQTFISTDVPDSIPEGAECSLMINSRIFFGSILPTSISTGWQLTGNNPGKTTSAWSAKFTTASVQGDVDLSSLNRSFTPPSQGGVPPTTYYTYEPTGGNPVTWSIANMTLNSAENGIMSLKYHNQKQAFNYTENYDTVICSIFGCNHNRGSSQHSTDITLDISASVPTEITGTGKTQDIKIDVSNQAVSVAARTSGGGPCGSDDLQSQVNKQLQNTIPKQITGKLNFSFNSVSVFALKNLLFPANNYIDLKNIYVPGDLLILGVFSNIQTNAM